MQGNKGEWSESYAALRIIGDRKIFVADRSGAMNPNEWMNVLALMRRETRERLVSYRYDANDVDVVIAVNEDPVYRLPASEFVLLADRLLTEINRNKSSSFVVTDELESALRTVQMHSLKAKSDSKSDVTLSVLDPRSGVTRSEIGFSIKSELGQPPTLFNTATASAPIYRLHGMTAELAAEVNAVVTAKGKTAVEDRCRLMQQRGIGMEYVGYPAKGSCSPFAENLDLINPWLPAALADVLRVWYLGGNIRTLPEVARWLEETNPLRISRPDVKYAFMLKNFLYAAYCGMTASTLWDGRSEVNGGFIRGSKTGEVLAFYALESEVFKDYLFRNCYFERPATSRKHGNYGTVYEEDGGWFIRLNFQIRYRVG